MKARLALCVMEINLHGTIIEEKVDVLHMEFFKFAFLQIKIFQYFTFNLSLFKYFPIRSNFKDY